MLQPETPVMLHELNHYAVLMDHRNAPPFMTTIANGTFEFCLKHADEWRKWNAMDDGTTIEIVRVVGRLHPKPST